MHEDQGVLLSPHPSLMESSVLRGTFAWQKNVSRVKIAVSSTNINPLKLRLQAVALKCRYIFQDLKAKIHLLFFSVLNYL